LLDPCGTCPIYHLKIEIAPQVERLFQEYQSGGQQRVTVWRLGADGNFATQHRSGAQVARFGLSLCLVGSIWLVNPLFSVAFFPKSVENVRFRHVLMQKTTFQPFPARKWLATCNRDQRTLGVPQC
jgi:hypothetical protein